jgi:hypothetical protein
MAGFWANPPRQTAVGGRGCSSLVSLCPCRTLQLAQTHINVLEFDPFDGMRKTQSPRAAEPLQARSDRSSAYAALRWQRRLPAAAGPRLDGRRPAAPGDRPSETRAATTKTSTLPSYSPVKAMSLPSGENAGSVSIPVPLVSRTASRIPPRSVSTCTDASPTHSREVLSHLADKAVMPANSRYSPGVGVEHRRSHRTMRKGLRSALATERRSRSDAP